MIMRIAKIALQGLSGCIGLIAAWFWIASAMVEIPAAPGAAFGGTSPEDPFNIAIRYAAQLNQWAALLTGVSTALLVIASLLDICSICNRPNRGE